MAEIVEIELTPEKIRAMPDAEKLSVLIEIALKNHKAICRQDKILDGNGVPGLCEQVRLQQERTTFQQKQLTVLWSVFSAGGGVLSTAVIMHLTK